MRCFGSLILIFSALAAPALAQEQQGAGSRGDDTQALRDEVNEVVDAYLLMKVQERLDLTDEQMLKALPLIRKHHQMRRDLEHRRFHLLRELHQLLSSGGATEERVVPLLRELKGIEVDLPLKTRQNVDAIDALLTPIQQAKYRLLEAAIDRRLRELRHRAGQHRGAPGGPDERWLPGPDGGHRPPRR
jgi:Spy/CpxP family protein refolding chaperone